MAASRWLELLLKHIRASSVVVFEHGKHPEPFFFYELAGYIYIPGRLRPTTRPARFFPPFSANIDKVCPTSRKPPHVSHQARSSLQTTMKQTNET